MTKAIDDLEHIFSENFNELSLEKRLETIITAWQSDSSSFEKLDIEIDLDEEMFGVLNELERKNLFADIEKLDLAVRSQEKRYEELSKYISQVLIPLYLADDREQGKVHEKRLERYLAPFYNNPVKSYEIFAEVLDKLICYDQSSIAVDLCKKTYTKIAESDEFFGNPKDNIAEIIVWDELQDVYARIKKGMEVDWAPYIQKFITYGYQFTQENLKSFEEVMKGHLNLDKMFERFKTKSPLVIFQIKLAFCCKMNDLDGTSFVTSNNFASKVINFLARIPGREKCPLKTFFKITPDLFTKHVIKLNDNGWFDTTYNQFAFIGALPIFLLVLLKTGIIEMKAVEEILPTIYITKTEFKKLHSDRPWVFNFIKKLETQASTLAQLYQES